MSTSAGSAAAPPPVAMRPTRALTVLLTLLVALGPMSTDLYLPSVPGIASDLAVSDAAAQLTIGLFILGFALMMLVVGPLADRFGRRPVILTGLAAYTLASIGCALAPSIEVLLAVRLVQAMGASVGPVLGRAVVRDLYPPREAGRVLGVMSSAMALAPILAPFLGGLLETEFGWRANFVCLVMFGLTLLLWVRIGLPETLPKPQEGRLLAGSLIGNYAVLLKHRRFLGFTFAVAFAFGSLFAWISNASFIVIDHFEVRPDRFGFAFGSVIFGYILGGLTGSRLGGRIGYGPSTGLGAGLLLLGGGGLVLLTQAGAGSLIGVVLLTNLTFIGAGIVIPQATAGALVPFPERAGSAAALVGFVQMSTGFLVNGASAAGFDGTPVPFALISAGCAALTLLAFALLIRPVERAISAAK